MAWRTVNYEKLLWYENFLFSEPFPSFVAFLHGVDKSIAELPSDNE